MFDPSTVPLQTGQLLLITDKVAAPADFVLLSILTSRLRSPGRQRCMLVSFSQTLSHWSSIAAKLSPVSNFASFISSKQLYYVDAQIDTTSRSLMNLHDKISNALEHEGNAGSEEFTTIVLDGLTLAEWTGTPTIEVMRFLRALRAMCNKHRASLVVRHHRLSEELDGLLRSLLHLCTWHLEVLPLSSGRSGAITGEIALHGGPLLDDSDTFDAIKRSEAIQYRLNDTGAVFFGRGTSSSVL